MLRIQAIQSRATCTAKQEQFNYSIALRKYETTTAIFVLKNPNLWLPFIYSQVPACNSLVLGYNMACKALLALGYNRSCKFHTIRPEHRPWYPPIITIFSLPNISYSVILIITTIFRPHLTLGLLPLVLVTSPLLDF